MLDNFDEIYYALKAPFIKLRGDVHGASLFILLHSLQSAVFVSSTLIVTRTLRNIAHDTCSSVFGDKSETAHFPDFPPKSLRNSRLILVSSAEV